GGNITGVQYEGSGVGLLTGKRLELLKEMVPRATRIAILMTDESGSRAQWQEATKGAPALGVKLFPGQISGADYEHAFAAMVTERAAALFVVASTILNRDRAQIIEKAAKYRLPAMYEWQEQVEVGGLMSYGNSTVELSRQVALYVDR